MLILNSPKVNETSKDINPHSWPSLAKDFGLINLRHLSKPEIVRRVLSYFLILTVRHPLSRLESGFMDKFVYTGSLKPLLEKEPEKFMNDLVYKYFQRFLK